MHTAWHRVNAVFTYFATVAAALCALTALVDVLVSPTPAPAVGTTTPAWPPASLSVREVRRLSLARGGRHEQAVLGGVTLNADLRRTFNWNTKQLFVTLRAEYETPRNALNQVVLWDAVVASRGAAKLELNDLRQEYPLTAQDGETLRGVPVNLTLAWNVMPRVGALREGHVTFPAAVVMPAEYSPAAAEGGGAGAGGAAGAGASADDDGEGEDFESADGEEDEYGDE